MNIQYNGTPVNQTTRYKYLGTTLDSSLTLSDNFDKMYKKTSSRLRLLNSLKRYLTKMSCKRIYEAMIVPIVTYNCTSHLKLTQTQLNKLQSLDRRASTVLGVNTVPLLKLIQKHAVLIIGRCLSDEVCYSFRKYFIMSKHASTTRNNGKLLKIPKVKLEFARSGFFFMGTSIFNAMPVNIRESHGSDFRDKVRKHFSIMMI